MDTLSPEERSGRMSRVRSKNSKPEMVIRRLVYSLGYRYRLHEPSLPGKPDLVFWGKHKIIFVHGCFWHRHGKCPLTRWPKSKLDFWKPKLESNKKRDIKNLKNLKLMGWDVLVIWECEITKPENLIPGLKSFLS
ncbi:MAG TPA: very short patch repair endonuclease [Pyrinomonadaceae bacterium]|nr:very short patch repair endonuclease [Pyrinomonadaceae bacterium]